MEDKINLVAKRLDRLREEIDKNVPETLVNLEVNGIIDILLEIKDDFKEKKANKSI